MENGFLNLEAEAYKIKNLLTLVAKDLSLNADQNDAELTKLLFEFEKYFKETEGLLAEDDGNNEIQKIEIRRLTEERAYLQLQLEEIHKKERECPKLNENLERRSKLDNMILDEKKRNISLNDTVESYKSLSDKVKELESLSDMLIFNDYQLEEGSSEITQYNLNKVYEKILGIRLEKSDNETFQVVFTLLKEDIVDSVFNAEMNNARSIKRRKLCNQLKGVSVNLNEAKLIFDSYIQILCDSLTKIQIEDAMSRYAVDWIDGSKNLTILLNSSSKIAQIKLPKYFPITGTSKIKVHSVTGYDDAKIKDFRISDDFEKLSQWVMSFIELHNSNLL